MRNLYLLIVFIFLIKVTSSQENNIVLTLDEVISLAKDQSFDALIAKHTFRGSYWEYRTFEAAYMPSLSASGTALGFERSISQEWQNGEQNLVEKNNNLSNVNLSLNQNVGFTGGRIFMQSNLMRIDNFDSESTQFASSPVTIGFSQPIFGYNSLKWDKKIEPIKFQEAQRKYFTSMEQVSLKAVNSFFDLALAQINLEIAKMNFSNTDTLYKISKGRFNIGTIAQNELLQMELSYLNSETDLKQAELDLQIKMFALRSFLGYNESVSIDLIIPAETPDIIIDDRIALEKAIENNPEVLSYNRLLTQAERDVARAKADRGFSVDMFAEYGLNGAAAEFNDIYINTENTSRLNLGFAIPILDWGQGKGRVKMAESNLELVNTSVMQNKVDFEQDVYLKVKQFNMQHNQLRIALKTDTIATLRYEVTKQRFLIGKIDVLDLNVALSEKDQNRRGYINALRSYYAYYYNVRKITLYDFINSRDLIDDTDNLVK